MNNKESLPDIERELMEHIDKDETARMQKNAYRTGVRIGLAVIFLAAAIFMGLMFMMPSEPSPIYWAGCGFAVLIMIASIAIVSVRLKRLQAGYFGSAGAAAEEYVDELKQRMRNSGK